MEQLVELNGSGCLAGADSATQALY